VSQARQLTILGSTGSIGQSTLAVTELNPDWTLYALTAHTRVDELAAQCLKYRPQYAVISTAELADQLTRQLQAADCETQVMWGEAALAEVAAADVVDGVMAAIVGAAGLEPTLAAVTAGKRLFLANKEALVMSGQLFMELAQQSGSQLIPVDSEHNAIFQCLPFDASNRLLLNDVRKIVLTASGGPFLNTPRDQLSRVTPAEACNHPNWDMGAKISVDSATMMNKGLELIEACYLFGTTVENVDILIHPQSIVHSMVHFKDGSVLAQMANPDMCVPIASALSWPERLLSGVAPLDLAASPALEFHAPDLERFPCLRLGMEAARASGTMPVVINAANEVAVAAFLEQTLAFDQIPLIIEEVMSKIPCEAASSLAIIQGIDQQARMLANELITKKFR